jgi:hypothetical protein
MSISDMYDKFSDKQFIDAAKRELISRAIEIDVNAPVSRGEHGAWVQAWVWVDVQDVQEET